MAAFHTACASFVSRNWGAGNRKRMMKSYLVSLSYSFVSGAVFGWIAAGVRKAVPFVFCQ